MQLECFGFQIFASWLTSLGQEGTKACLCMPTPVDNLTAVLLALLESHLRLLLRNIDGIDITSRLNAETCARAARGETFDGRYIDVCACVKLESRLCAGYFQVDLAIRMVERREFLQRSRAGINRYVLCVCVHYKAVVNGRLLLAESELLVGLDAREFLDRSLRNEVFVYDQIFVVVESNFCSCNSWSFSEVEVAKTIVRSADSASVLNVTYLWLVMLIAVSSTSSPTSSASYSMCRTSCWAPSTFSVSWTYQTRNSTVPG